MINGKVIALGLLMFVLGLSVGILLPDLRSEPARIAAMTDLAIEKEMSSFRMCMAFSSKVSCRMDINHFRLYYDYKGEQERRASETETVEPEEQCPTLEDLLT